TLVLDSEDNVRRLIENGKNSRPGYHWPEGWKQIEKDLFGIAIDNRDKHTSRILEKLGGLPTEEAPLVAPFLDNMSELLFRVDAGDAFTMEASLTCTAPGGAEALTVMVHGMLALGRTGYDQMVQGLPEQERESTPVKFGKELLRQTRVERDGSVVRVRTEAKEGFADAMKAVLAEAFSKK